MSESLVIDPLSEDASNTVLTLINPGAGIDVMSQKYPLADRDRLTASGADVEGMPLVQSQFRARTITLEVRCFGTHTVMRAKLAELTTKVGKLARYGGTLQRTLTNGDVIVFDIQDADLDVPADFYMVTKNSAICTLTLLCKPFGRGPTTTYGSASETTLPELVFTVTAPLGDVPALGKLEVTEGSAVDQWFVQWGLESHYYPGSAAGTTTAALAFSGVTRLAYNGAAALAVSGAANGTVLNQGTLTTSYGAMCSLASSGTVYPTHIGTYGVWARLYMGTANAGTVTAALEWSQADLLNYTRNDGTVLVPSRKGAFLHTYLGQVRLDKVTTGVQRWDGRIIAKSTTVGDDLAVDRLYLFPVLDGYGEASGVQRAFAPTVFSARDEFEQTAGALTGKTLPTGGTWGGAGDADDFTMDTTGHTAQRTAVSDTATSARFGRLVTASGPSLAAVTVSAQVTSVPASSGAYGGVIARYVDASNFVCATFRGASGPLTEFVLFKFVGGVATTLRSSVVFTSVDSGSVYLVVGAAGNYWAAIAGVIALSGSDADLATGGALASGKVGIVDWQPNATAATRSYDNFLAYSPPADAAMYASKKLSVYHDHVGRQDSSGTAEWKPSDYRGDYLHIPPAQYGGTARMIVKACRTDPYTGVDSGIDDISAVLSVTPRYLHIPE
jgi:hypothetical protein